MKRTTTPLILCIALLVCALTISNVIANTSKRPPDHNRVASRAEAPVSEVSNKATTEVSGKNEPDKAEQMNRDEAIASINRLEGKLNNLQQTLERNQTREVSLLGWLQFVGLLALILSMVVRDTVAQDFDKTCSLDERKQKADYLRKKYPGAYDVISKYIRGERISFRQYPKIVLSTENTVLYLLRIIGSHAFVFMIVVGALLAFFSWKHFDVAILSCIEIFFAFIGAYYASLADHSSQLAHNVSQRSYEKANLAMSSIMNFSDDLGGFVERLKTTIQKLREERTNITLKFVTVIPKFGKIGLDQITPTPESYYKHMRAMHPNDYKTWDEFLKETLQQSSAEGVGTVKLGKVKLQMLSHASAEYRTWIHSILKASGLAGDELEEIVEREVKDQDKYLADLQTYEKSVFEWQPWRSVGNNTNSIPFQFVIIKMGIDEDAPAGPRKSDVPSRRYYRKIYAPVAWAIVILASVKALFQQRNTTEEKTSEHTRPERKTPPQLKGPPDRYEGSKLMFLFSGDYIYNNFLVKIEEDARVDLSMQEFVKFTKGYYSEERSIIQFFDKLFDFFWDPT